MAMPHAVKIYRDNARYWGEQAVRSIQMIWNDGRDHDPKMAEAYANGAYADAVRAIRNARASLSVVPSMQERQRMELVDLAKLLESRITNNEHCVNLLVRREGRMVVVSSYHPESYEGSQAISVALKLAESVSVPGTTWWTGEGSFQVRF